MFKNKILGFLLAAFLAYSCSETTEEVNLLEQEGYEWLLKNTHSEEVEILEGSKAYNEERNSELFDLIQKGSSISKGELFEYFKKLITAKK